MKKVFLVFFASLALLFLFSGMVQAAAVCTDSEATGFVPCGVKLNADGKTLACPCELGHFFIMLLRVYKFAVYTVALPLAGLMIVFGGVLMLVSAGNPGLADKGKNLIKYAIISLILIFSSWLIIDVVLKTIGYPLKWYDI